MAKTLGYMVTWTTYGSWLQGDERGYVKKGKVLGANRSLREVNVAKQAGKTVKLTRQEQETVRKAIESEAERLVRKIYSMTICHNHVHIVVNYTGEPIELFVGHCKNSARVTLRANGFSGRVWTRGYDKRYCFDEKSLKDRIDYVRRHN
ncbi:MAG: transposase [Sedimentisphaerales bacterium]